MVRQHSESPGKNHVLVVPCASVECQAATGAVASAIGVSQPCRNWLKLELETSKLKGT